MSPLRTSAARARARRWVPWLAAALSSGCGLYSHGLDREQAAKALPPQYPTELLAQASAPRVARDRYWAQFGSDALDQLVEAAIAGNHDLAATAAVVRRAGFGARITWSDRLPEVTYDLGLGYTERRSNVSGLGRAPGGVIDVGVAARYEVDLWGRLRSYDLGAESTFEAARWDLAAARVTVSAETVLRWLDVQTANAQLDLLGRQAEEIARTERLVELRYRQGDATWPDVLSLTQTRVAIEEQRATLRRARAEALAELRLLVGAEAAALDRLAAEALPETPALPEIGLPVALLEQRPDVQAAWFRALSAAWTASARRAERLPTLTLQSAFAFSSNQPSTLLDNWIASILAGLTGPLFDFMGRKYAEQEAIAATDAAVENMKSTLRQAFRDVERALAANRALAARERAVSDRVELARTRATRLEYRYRNGVTPYVELYLAVIARMEAERDAIQVRADRLAQRVQLARALGGGWTAAEAGPS